MSEHKPIHTNAPRFSASHAGRELTCEEWEALLVDFLDGALPPSEIELFRSHDRSCEACGKMFSEAGKGREWLTFLRVEPEIAPALVSRILARTAGALVDARLEEVFQGKSAAAQAVASSIPSAPLPFWKRLTHNFGLQRLGQPRLLMTAAMAFFSITLTLNIAGIRLNAIHLADLRPSAISTNLDKEYHLASARVVRYYDSLRFVYEMEAKVRELRRDADIEDTKPADKPAQPSGTTQPQDGGHKSGGKSEGSGAAQPQAALWGERVEASLRIPMASTDRDTLCPNQHNIDEIFPAHSTGQAERGVA